MAEDNRFQKRLRGHIVALASPQGAVARRAECALIRYYGSRALDALMAACSDPSPQVRYRAAYTLGCTRDPRAFDTILALTRDSNGEVRYDATLALGKLGDHRAIGPLIALMSEPDPESCVSSAAALALGELGVNVLPAVIAAFHHGTPEARRLAPSILAGIGDRAVLGPLAELLTDDPGRRLDAMETLAAIGTRECLVLIDSHRDDESEAVRSAANRIVSSRSAQPVT